MSAGPATRSGPAPAAGERPDAPPAERRPVSTLAAARTILAKDLRSELRTLESVPAMAIFAVTAFVIFRYALDRTTLSGDLAAGVLLVTLLFAAILAINRIFVPEREQHGMDGIRLAPVDRTALLWAKVGALVIYLLALQAVVVPIFALFFGTDAAALGPLALVLVLTNLGVAVAGAFVASLALMSRARDLLVPLLLLPMMVPLVIGAAGAAEPILAEGGPQFERFGTFLGTIALYDLIVSLVAWATFDFVVED